MNKEVFLTQFYRRPEIVKRNRNHRAGGTVRAIALLKRLDQEKEGKK